MPSAAVLAAATRRRFFHLYFGPTLARRAVPALSVVVLAGVTVLGVRLLA